MIPQKSDEKWKLLVSGKISHQFEVFSASMLISRLSQCIKEDDSVGMMQNCIDEAFDFFIKYESIFVDDINTIFG